MKREDGEKSSLLEGHKHHHNHRGSVGGDELSYVAEKEGGFRVERKRWYILTIYSVMANMQGLVWATFSTVSETASEYYGPHFTQSIIDLLLNYGPIAYIPSVFFTMWLLTRGSKGLRQTVFIGGALTTLGTIIRLFPSFMSETRRQDPSSFVCLHIGQFLNGLAGPMWMATPSAISATWFAPEERTLATAIAQLSNNFGSALAFLVALPVNNSHGMAWLLYSECVFSCVTFVVLCSHFPATPSTPPSATAQQRLEAETKSGADPSNAGVEVLKRFLTDMVILAKDPSFVILALAGGGCSGVFNTWSASMPNILQGVISDTQNKWLGFATNCAGLGGSISVGRLADSSLFHRRFKALILLLFAVSSVCFLWFACSLPVGWTASTVVIAHAPFWSYMVAGILACFFLGGTVPLSYEIAAEATYPIPEGSSAGLITLGNNLGGLILLFVMPHVPQDWINTFMFLASFCSFIALMFIRSEYRRSDLDETLRQPQMA